MARRGVRDTDRRTDPGAACPIASPISSTPCASGAVRVVDLTQPLSERTPVLRAARAVRQHARAHAAASSAATTTAARRGRGTCWRSASTSARTSTRRSTGSPAATARTWPACRRPGSSARRWSSTSPPRRPQDPDYLLTVDRGRAFEAEHGALPEGVVAAAAHRLGRARPRPGRLPQRRLDGQPHTPGIDAECARWLAQEQPGRRRRGRDRRHRRGRGRRLRPALPRPPLPPWRRASTASPSWPTWPSCRRSARVVVVAPLKLAGGTGSPTRALALVGA